MHFPPAAQPIILGLMVFFGLYMGYEVWRWLAGNPSMLTPGQFRRRLWGGILLEADLALWLLAVPLMRDRPARERLIYLLVAMLFVLIPMLLAVREAAFVARQYARWRGDLVRSLGKADRRGKNGSPP